MPRRSQPVGNLEGKTITATSNKRPSGSPKRSRRKETDSLGRSQKATMTRGKRVGRGRQNARKKP